MDLHDADKADVTSRRGARQGSLTALADLIQTLWLYIGRYEETQLTTEQKELLYDLVDEYRLAVEPDAEPLERWWLSTVTEEKKELVSKLERLKPRF